jgi:secreted trypsin-like serine protease
MLAKLMRHFQVWACMIASLMQIAVNADEAAYEASNEENRVLNIFNNTDKTYARIIGGTFVNVDEYPWFARATIYNDSNQWGGCGGSLVSPSFVLTAAHCIYDDFKNSGGYDVGSRCYGSADKKNNNCGQSGNQYRKAAWIWVDPKYSEATVDYDYALVRLASPITNIEPVLMNTNSNVPSGGGDVIGIGFGATKKNGREYSLKLLHVTLDALTRTNCKKKYNSLTPRMICASRKGKDTCSGDSGGPLITDTKTPKLIGLTSWGGMPCSNQNEPGVYSSISARYDTLIRIICDNTPSKHPTASFCDGGGQPPATSPVAPPTSVTGPSDCNNGGCPGGTSKLEIEMLTDQFGHLDNFWYVKKGSKKVLNVKTLNNSTVYEWCSCFPTGKYKYFIKDREGDGFLPPGYLKLKWKGKQKLNLDGSTGEWKEKKKNLSAK